MVGSKASQRRICIGQIKGPHGIRGLVKVKCHADDPALLDEYGPLYIGTDGDETLTLTRKNPMKDIWLVTIDGVPDRTAAEKLPKYELFIDRDKMPDIDDPDAFYFEDLMNMTCFDETDTKIGHVCGVFNFGAGDILEIKPDNGRAFMIPFNDETIVSVDMDGDKITLNIPDGFIEPQQGE